MLDYQLVDREGHPIEAEDVPLSDPERDLQAVDLALRSADARWGLVQPGLWRNPATDEELNLAEAVRRYQLWGLLSPAPSPTGPEWLDSLLPKHGSHYLDANRLWGGGPPSSYRPQTRSALAVSTLSERLRHRVRQAKDKYNRCAQQLDSAFVKRALDFASVTTRPAPKASALQELLTGLSRKQKRYAESGLLDAPPIETLGLDAKSVADPALRRLLDAYADMTAEKLEIQDDLDRRMTGLAAYLTDKFGYTGKSVAVTSSGIRVATPQRKDLPLPLLSAGEQ